MIILNIKYVIARLKNKNTKNKEKNILLSIYLFK